MRISVLLLLGALGAAAGVPPAQQASVVVIGSYKCSRADLAEIDAFMRDVQAPLMDALVEEGLWLEWKYLTHRYGDEFNRVILYRASDLETHLRASTALTSRLARADPAPTPFTRSCFEHKDNIYDQMMP